MAAKLQVDKYRQALKRLVDRGESINLDAVAREAGSGPGSIKTNRTAYQDLILEIVQAADKQAKAEVALDMESKLKQDKKELEKLLDNALEREICLLEEVYTLREENRQLKAGRPFAVHQGGKRPQR